MCRLLARMVELVEIAAGEDVAAVRVPNAQKALREAASRVAAPVDRAYAELHPGVAALDMSTGYDRDRMVERYGLFYGAKMAYPDEAPDVAVRRRRRLEDPDEPEGDAGGDR